MFFFEDNKTRKTSRQQDKKTTRQERHQDNKTRRQEDNKTRRQQDNFVYINSRIIHGHSRNAVGLYERTEIIIIILISVFFFCLRRPVNGSLMSR